VTGEGTAAAGSLVARVVAAACVTGAYRLPDGRVLDAYFDEYALAADPTLLHEVADALAGLIPPGAGVLAGLELGGVPLVVALSAATGLPAAFVRRTAKRYGTLRQIEGHPVAGAAVVLVDDVVRSGGQMLAMTRVLRGAGATVLAAACVLERPLGGRVNLAAAGVELAARSANTTWPPRPSGQPPR
jgi:orotate phosphoribosyltransferase